jgi:hypothetical protein
MSTHRPWLPLRNQAAETVAALTGHPARTTGFAIAGLLLVWLILTKSLPYVLAESAPELALWLDPGQPVALLTLANRARAAFVGRPNASADATATASPLPGETANVIEPGRPSAPVADSMTHAETRDMLRGEIRSLANRIIASDPLNARAFRLLAETAEEPAQVRALMQEAVKRSRRESLAVFWLMNDSFKRRDFSDVIAKADILLRTREEFTSYVMSYLGEVAAAPEGRRLLVSLLAKKPRWRRPFFNALPNVVQRADTPLNLMLALKDVGSPPSTAELSPYLGSLVSKNIVDTAYNAWLQLMPREKLTSLGLLNNANFTANPSGLPFDWSIMRGQNAVVDFVALHDGSGERALRFGFGAGRVRFPETSQILLLPPGRYRLDGAFRGVIAARRGLRWEIRCMGAKSSLAETDMIYGHPRSWQDFALDIEMPDRDDCRAQQLRLYHHARSPSEELMSGEILFRGLRLTRLEQQG